MPWHRIVLDDRDGSKSTRWREAGERLLHSDRWHPGMSIWQISRHNALGSEMTGAPPAEVVQTMSFDTVEIYLSPETLEALDLAGLPGADNIEACDRPPKDDVGLVVGDDRDWENLWK
jgi:hypothetical protein